LHALAVFNPISFTRRTLERLFRRMDTIDAEIRLGADIAASGRAPATHQEKAALDAYEAWCIK
jgi:hypothetical protein